MLVWPFVLKRPLQPQLVAPLPLLRFAIDIRIRAYEAKRLI